MKNFNIEISYRQIAVFYSNLDEPFNDWSEVHVQQGFAWRDKSVSFSTLIDAGPMNVEIEFSNTLNILDESIRVISVPFEISAGVDIEIASIADGQVFEFKPGKFQLIFQTGKRGDEDWCRFTFIKDGDFEPKILKQDTGLKPLGKLSMEAQPAT